MLRCRGCESIVCYHPAPLASGQFSCAGLVTCDAGEVCFMRIPWGTGAPSTTASRRPPNAQMTSPASASSSTRRSISAPRRGDSRHGHGPPSWKIIRVALLRSIEPPLLVVGGAGILYRVGLCRNAPSSRSSRSLSRLRPRWPSSPSLCGLASLRLCVKFRGPRRRLRRSRDPASARIRTGAAEQAGATDEVRRSRRERRDRWGGRATHPAPVGGLRADALRSAGALRYHREAILRSRESPSDLQTLPL